MFTPRFQLAYLAATLVVFCVLALLTRAGARRVAGAVCSALVFTALSAPVDHLAARQGWWRYPSCVNPAHPPLAVYLGQALLFVGTIALIGWRVQRRFGARGVMILAAIVCSLGLARNLAVAAALPDVIRFGPMPAAALADLGAWALVVLVAVGVSRPVGGAARSR